MADKAMIWTDKKLSQMERKISNIYKTSAKGISKKWNAFMTEAEKEISDLQKEYEDAKKSGDKDLIKSTGIKLSQQKKSVTLQNEQYQDMIKETTSQLAHTNEIALAYINGQMPSIYMNNFNEVKVDANNLGVQFGIVDEATVKRLITDGDLSLLRKRLDIPKDERWNRKQLNSSVLQGILQGESIPEIAKRIYHITDRNESSAVRNARTMVTCAQNRGRLDSYKELESEGLVTKKVWMATPDGRTRDWHIEMDGQEVNLNESFIDGNGEELEYPGDPAGPPESVYNCRCTMITHIVGVRMENGQIKALNYLPESELHKRQMSEEKDRRVNEGDGSGVVKGSQIPDNNPYSRERKDNALWAKSPREYDNVMRETAGTTWRNATAEERSAIYEYTAYSDPQNMPTRGCERSWNNHVGTENMTISKQTADQIDATTRYIEKSILPQDTWLQRGVSNSGAARFLNVPKEFFYGSEEDMRNAVIGKVVKDDAFFSCGSSKGSGFDGVIFNIYCPEGTQGAYVEPFSHFGEGDGLSWDGKSTQAYFGGELETLLQRSTEFNVMKVEKNGSNWFFDIDVVGQNPKPLEEMFGNIL